MKKIKRSRILILGVFVYIVFQVGSLFISKSTETLALESEELNAKIKTKGLFIREEHIVKSTEKGVLDTIYKEGEKVKKAEDVAYVYKDDKIEKINSQIKNLNEEIKKSRAELEKKSNELSKDLVKNQIKTKNEQKKILEVEKEKITSCLKTDISGIISYKFDGNEEKYNLENLDKITKDDIENTSNNYEDMTKENNNIKDEEPIAKIINNYESYLAICVDKEQAKNFKLGNNIKISSNNLQLDAKVYKIYKSESNIVIIFKITNQNIGIYDTRVEEFDIIYKQMEGLKIPKSSIKKVGNKKGVYSVNEQTQDIEFIELKGIGYENDEFVFIDYYTNNIQGIETVSLYDEIILKPNNINKNIKIK